jgi:predicted RNase H-like HicB family nuclease
MSKRFLVVVERTTSGYSAYSPDLPGCVATGQSQEEVESNIREAIEFHVDGLREEGHPVPEPHTYSSYIQLSA